MFCNKNHTKNDWKSKYVDIAFLFTSVESLRPERRKREKIESQSRTGGGGGEPKNTARNHPIYPKINQNSCEMLYLNQDNCGILYNQN